MRAACAQTSIEEPHGLLAARGAPPRLFRPDLLLDGPGRAHQPGSHLHVSLAGDHRRQAAELVGHEERHPEVALQPQGVSQQVGGIVEPALVARTHAQLREGIGLDGLVADLSGDREVLLVAAPLRVLVAEIPMDPRGVVTGKQRVPAITEGLEHGGRLQVQVARRRQFTLVIAGRLLAGIGQRCRP